MHTRLIFQRLGLPKHADLIYHLLQKRGPLRPAHVAAALHIYRPAIYRALSALCKHRFVFSSSEGKRTQYHAASTRIITTQFREISADVAATLADRAVKQEAYLQKGIRFLHGPKGIRAAFDDVITHTPRGQTFYRYTSEKDLDAVNRYLSADYRRRRDAKKLERLVISNPISGKRKKPRLERFIKFIPPEFNVFDQNIIQLIYGDRVLFIDLNNEQVIIIENKALADFQKVIFQQFYQKL